VITGTNERSHLNAARRRLDLATTSAAPVDLLVVGGGITGGGVALDAAARGLSVALVEREDLASGTSRWSSKFAHGGLRYISKGQLSVAWESAVERNVLLTTVAPHLVRPLPVVLPMLSSYPPGSRVVSRGVLGIADVLRAASRSPASLPATSWIDAAAARRLAPTVDARTTGAYVHVDGMLEDDARLVVAVARTAAALGARIITHCRALEVTGHGVRVRDEMTGEEHDLAARAVVVAAGVWSGGLVPDVPLQPSRGAHLVVRASAFEYPRAAFNVMLPGTLSRFVFACPRPDGTVLVGLTDDAVDQITDVPEVTEADEAWLLEMVSSGLTRPITSADVIGRYAGLRPLLSAGDAKAGGTAADISRRHALLQRDGIIVIVGGKLTTYRRMAEDAVDAVCRRLGRGDACRTRSMPLVGAPGPDSSDLPDRLQRRFGAEAAAVADCGGGHGLEPVAPGVPALRCELEWALRVEGALTVADVLERRLRLDMVDDWRSAARPAVEAAVAERAGG
jgi:glycerol-3-phosphate dehydrogenase